MTAGPLAHRTGRRIVADPSRAVVRLFVPGQQHGGPGESQASRVVARVLGLTDAEVTAELRSLVERFGDRHDRVADTWERHADRIANRLQDTDDLSDERWLLLGASFTQEYAIEGAALCNPCLVEHPDQRGTAPGDLRVAMSVRSIGEGHRSCIGFRTGTVDGAGHVSMDEAVPRPVVATVLPGPFDRELFHAALRELGADGESASYVLDGLPPRFGRAELEDRMDRLAGEHDTRRNSRSTIALLQTISASSYTATVAGDSDLSQRVLWPASPAEANGMEDVRFVRFVDDDGTTTYYGTYTAYDGASIHQHLLESADLLTFWSTPLAGPAAADKGLALFPRRVAGRFVALSRADGETNAVAHSDDGRRWARSVPLAVERTTTDLIQLGNCGAPIETAAGWLVLTHGVGPMRTYRMGALLLDRDDPTKVIGQLARPLLEPAPDEADGYVPHVVYSCGALLHRDTLVIPFGVADQSIALATVAIDELLGQLT